MIRKYYEAIESGGGGQPEVEILYRWVKASERLPEENGYYVAVSFWEEEGNDQIIPPDRSDTYFSDGKFKEPNYWKVYEWLEPLPSQPSVDALGEMETLAANHATISYAQAPEQSEDDAKYIQDVSYNSFIAGYTAASHPSPSVDAEPSPQEAPSKK